MMNCGKKLTSAAWRETESAPADSFVLRFPGSLIIVPGLNAVAAQLHITPAARMIFAGVKEKPATAFVTARSNPVQVVRGQQSGGGFENGPERSGGVLFEVGPLPSDLPFVTDGENAMVHSVTQSGIEGL